jgi:adenine/guanine phosphoribosyltransferase-like PRPP-binding protein
MGQVSWVEADFGIELRNVDSPVGLTMNELVQLALRRNPRRAQLLVSTVLGKHLAADPRVIAGAGRLLGALAARKLAGADQPVPAQWSVAAGAAITGVDPDGLLILMQAEAEAANCDNPTLTFGFAETATSLGHLVADQLGSPYLHSTRRRDGDVPVFAEFSEPHSHATGHLLRPDLPTLMDGSGPLVLVDDELSTGRTALNVIEALHTIAPRPHYMIAGLVDVRSPADDAIRAAVAERLGCRIDVVSVVRGEIALPTGILEKVAAELGDPVEPDSRASAGPGALRAVNTTELQLPWPADVPTGGRHGLVPASRPAFDVAVNRAASTLAGACGTAHRVLVIGTEEFMYLPLRLALALAADPARRVRFQSTTRSPVHAIDRPGYPIRRRVDFSSTDLSEMATAQAIRHLYNACWSDDESGLLEADLIVVIDDGLALPGPTGVAVSIAAATEVPVLLAVIAQTGGGL